MAASIMAAQYIVDDFTCATCFVVGNHYLDQRSLLICALFRRHGNWVGQRGVCQLPPDSWVLRDVC